MASFCNKASIFLAIVVIFGTFPNWMADAAEDAANKFNNEVLNGAAASVNILILGGIFNIVLSVINLILALVNFSIIVGNSHCRIQQLAEKMRLAVVEVKSRDMHPRVKMALMQKMDANSKPIFEMFIGIKDGGVFDNANDLFPGQKETRIPKQKASKKSSASDSKKSKKAERFSNENAVSKEQTVTNSQLSSASAMQ